MTVYSIQFYSPSGTLELQDVYLLCCQSVVMINQKKKKIAEIRSSAW